MEKKNERERAQQELSMVRVKESVRERESV